MGMLSVVLNVLEALAAVFAFLFWQRTKYSYWRSFPFYLMFIVAAELVGRYLEYKNFNTSNYALYNYLVIPVEFLFFFWIFHHAFNKSKYKSLPMWCGGIYMACWLVDVFYLGRHNFFFYSFSYTIGNLLLLVLILRFFFQLVTGDAILRFRKDMMFWVSAGLLIYY